MFSDYRRRVLPKAERELALLKSLIPKTRLALLCYEAEASDCHRRFVAEAISEPKNIVDLDMLAITSRARTVLTSRARTVRHT